MKTEGELDAQIAKLFDLNTENAPDTKAKRRLISDEETLREMDFSEACDEYIRAGRKFEKLDRITKAQKGIPDNLCEWFDALEEQYQADKRLWLLFVGKDRSRQSNLLYCEFRNALMSSRKLRANA
jgi:hypothetical protein